MGHPGVLRRPRRSSAEISNSGSLSPLFSAHAGMNSGFRNSSLYHGHRFCLLARLVSGRAIANHVLRQIESELIHHRTLARGFIHAERLALDRLGADREPQKAKDIVVVGDERELVALAVVSHSARLRQRTIFPGLGFAQIEIAA